MSESLNQEISNKNEDASEVVFDNLYKIYRNRLQHHIISTLRRTSCNDPITHGEDVEQQTWIAAHKALDKFYEGEKINYTHPGALLYQISRRNCLRHIREHYRSEILEIEDNIELEGQIDSINEELTISSWLNGFASSLQKIGILLSKLRENNKTMRNENKQIEHLRRLNDRAFGRLVKAVEKLQAY